MMLMKQILSFISNLLLISALYLFAGCASVSIEPQKLNENITSINENFTIEVSLSFHSRIARRQAISLSRNIKVLFQ